MSLETIVFLALGAIAGSFVNGLAGTGTALFALGFYLVVLDPISAVAIVALMSVVTGLQGLWTVRAEIPAYPRHLLIFVGSGLLGVPFGIMLLNAIDAGTLRIAIAILLILYGGYFGFQKALPAFSRETPFWDATIAFVGGVLGGSASASGALPAMWLSLRPWAKSRTRALLQPYNVAILGTTAMALFFRGAYDRNTLAALLIVVPTGLLSAQVGIAVFKALSDIHAGGSVA